MKKKLLSFILFTLNVTVLVAQLYVQPTATEGSYVYVNDTYVFVTGAVRLIDNTSASTTNQTAPSIALRNQSQLLQGANTNTNSGNGVISIYQEGTTNNYDYNFWASPVGLPTTGNGNFSMKPNEQIIKQPATVLTSNEVLVDNDISDGNNSGNILNFASRWLYSYQNNAPTPGQSSNDEWTPILNSAELPAGYGFTMKGVIGLDGTLIPGEGSDAGSANNDNNFNTPNGGQRYDFRGRPNNGIITGITVDPDKKTLVGNPYPSALDLSYFLLENSSGINGDNTTPECIPITTRYNITTGIAYFWESDPTVESHFLADYQGGYSSFSPLGTVCTTGTYTAATFLNYNDFGESEGPTGTSGNTDLKRRFSPVGQGFFVEGNTGSELQEIVYNNNQRVYVPEGTLNNSDFKSADNVPKPVRAIGLNRVYEDITNMAKPSQLKLAIGINDTYTRQLSLAFLDTATSGIDTAIDAVNLSPLPTDVNFDLEGAQGAAKENGYLINGIPIDESQWIPLLIKAEHITEYKFKIYDTHDFPFSEVYLYDDQTGAYRDILNDEAFLILPEDTYRDRFYMKFVKDNVSEDEETLSNEDTNLFLEDGVLESFSVVQNNKEGRLEIHNPLTVTLSDVLVLDLTGKNVINQSRLGSQSVYSFPTSNLSTGIYIVQFTTKSGLRNSRKITIIN